MESWRCRSSTLLIALLVAGSVSASAQLGSRPAEEWIKTLDGTARVSSLRIDDVVAALRLQPGQIVADIGAGSGLFDVPLAKAVGPRGRVYAVEIGQSREVGHAAIARLRARTSAQSSLTRGG